MTISDAAYVRKAQTLQTPPKSSRQKRQIIACKKRHPQRERGGSWVLGRVEPGGRDRERQLKNQHNAAKHCDVCHSLRDVEKGRITKEEALAKSGWDRASEYERGLLLDIFGMEKPPQTIPAVGEPKAFVPAPSRQPAIEIDPALDAVVDALCAEWTSPKAEAFADAPGSEAEAG